MVGTTAETHDDAAIACLADERRRAALRCLREYGMPMTLADLADDVAARETETPVHRLSDETVERVAATLHHAHLPKLADAGFLSYDVGTNVATLSEQGETFDQDRLIVAAP